MCIRDRFLHAVRSGPANQSYGLQVAQLAGIPASVIDKARDKLKQLESENIDLSIVESGKPLPNQGDLFGSPPHPSIEYLEKLNPDEITAKEALAILYELKNKTK